MGSLSFEQGMRCWAQPLKAHQGGPTFISLSAFCSEAVCSAADSTAFIKAARRCCSSVGQHSTLLAPSQTLWDKAKMCLERRHWYKRHSDLQVHYLALDVVGSVLLRAWLSLPPPRAKLPVDPPPDIFPLRSIPSHTEQGKNNQFRHAWAS